MADCGCLAAVCSGLVAAHSCLQLFSGSNRSIQMAVFRKITDLRAGAAFLRFSRYTRKPFPVHMACSVPEKGVSGTEYPFCTPEACFEHGGLLKTRRVHQEAFLSTARIFRTGGGFLRYGMQPDMLNYSRCELLSDFLSYPFPITTAMVDTFANCMIKFQYWQFLTSPLHGRLEPIFFWFE